MKSLSVIALVTISCLLSGNAHAQRGLGDIDVPDHPDLPRPDADVNLEFDYRVEFAGPPQTGFMVINDRGVERGPYNSYDEAHDVGMQTPWVYFWIDEIEYQNWYTWDTFDLRSDAQAEVNWLQDIGFWARIQEVRVWSFDKSTLATKELEVSDSTNWLWWD